MNERQEDGKVAESDALCRELREVLARYGAYFVLVGGEAIVLRHGDSERDFGGEIDETSFIPRDEVPS